MIAVIKKEKSKIEVNIVDDIDLDNFVINIDEPVEESLQNIVEPINEPIKEVAEPVEEPIEEVIIDAPKVDKKLSIEDIKKQIQEKISGFSKI
jgi:hypothetical protein